MLTAAQKEVIAKNLVDDFISYHPKMVADFIALYADCGLSLPDTEKTRRELGLFYAIIESTACLGAFPEQTEKHSLSDLFIEQLVHRLGKESHEDLSAFYQAGFDDYSQVFDLGALDTEKGRRQLAKLLTERLGLRLPADASTLAERIGYYFGSVIAEDQKALAEMVAYLK